MTIFGVVFILLAFAAGAASVILSSTIYQQIYFILVALFWLFMAFLVQSESNKRDVVKAIERMAAQAGADESHVAEAEPERVFYACPFCKGRVTLDMDFCNHCGQKLPH